MDIIFNIVENVEPDSFIILTIIFAEKYNVSIGKNGDNITIYLYESDKRKILKYYGLISETSRYNPIKKYIQELIDNVPFYHISGISSIENINYLKDFFIVSADNAFTNIINIDKKFY
jgi:hypothetical protein